MPETGLRLLIIDDCPEDREAYRRMVRTWLDPTYVVSEATSAAEGLDLLRAQQADCVLLDYSLPDMDGLEFLETLGSMNDGPGPPVVMLTGAGSESVAVEAMKRGASDYLIKGTTNGETLQLAVHKALENAVLKRQLTEKVDELSRVNEALRHLATHDSLTGLANRAQLWEHVDSALSCALRYGRPAAVIFLDVDFFKDLNDSHGHSTGDRILQEVAERLRKCVRNSDVVARWGGDEFVILLRDLSHFDDAGVVADHILRSVGEPIVIDDQEFRISVSAGISIFPQDATDRERLISNADAALYAAKQLGRSTSQFYTEDLSARAIERRVLEKQLREALREDQFVLHYQPQMDTNTNQVIGVEALIRWIHPDLGLMPPSVFIPVAEQTGLIEPIGEWVIRRACEQGRLLRRAGFPDLRMAVNLSVQQLRHRHLIPKINEALEASETHPSLLELEITESGVMKDFERSAETLHTLKNQDIRIAIDDFGTGHSSLNYLKRLPVDLLKIDRSFVRELQLGSSDEAIIKAIVAMAGSVKLETIAEGVETAGQLALLRANDCYRMQGFLLARPMPLEETGRWLQARASAALASPTGFEPVSPP